MNTLFLECKMGAAGDMLAAALFDLVPNTEKVLNQLNEIGLPNVKFKLETSTKCGIQGKHFSVIIDGREEKSCDITNNIKDNHCHHHNHCHEHPECQHIHHHIEFEDDNQHSHEHEQGLEHQHKDDNEHHHEHCSEHLHDHEHCHEHCHNHHHDDEHEHHHNHEHEHHHEHCCEHTHNHDHEHEHEHHHEHHGLHDIEHIVLDQLNIPSQVKNDIMDIYKIIAEAESQVHGVPITDIHFHEVGSIDAIADITTVCLLMNELKPDNVIASPIHVGNGQVKCAHGILPVPAPATALILKGIPYYSGNIDAELCTPTGAAILKHFVSEFGNQPIMRVDKIGYGMGNKNFSQANCVRAILGETSTSDEEVIEFCCNIDDMTAEEIAFAMERLFEAGALDVYTTPIGMKKNRPGILFTCMCEKSNRDVILNLMFKHTSTLGIRENICNRYVLNRKIENLTVEGEEVKLKKVSGYGTSREKYEYNDLAKIAIKHNLSLKEARKWVENSL